MDLCAAAGPIEVREPIIRSMIAHDFTTRRVAARSQLLDAIATASQQHGATAAHLLGSLGRQTADAFSDIDGWLTFPDQAIATAVRTRLTLYQRVGDLLLTHEAPSNRPLGGVYTLALYQTAAGPVQVDWYLAPQRTSRVAPEAAVCFEYVSVPRGEWQLDGDAFGEERLSDRVTWLIAMLFIASKKLMRDEDASFLRFVGEAYRDVLERQGLGQGEATDPMSLGTVVAMLQGLAPLCDPEQLRALLAVETYARGLVIRV